MYWPHWVFTAVHRLSLLVAHVSHCPAACGILVPRPGIKLMSLALEGRFLTTGPPGTSLPLSLDVKEILTTAAISLQYFWLISSEILWKSWMQEKLQIPESLQDDQNEGKLLSHVWLFAVPLTVAYQAPLSMAFSRQEYWSGLPFPSPGGSSWPGDQTQFSWIAGRHFTLWATRDTRISSGWSE